MHERKIVEIPNGVAPSVKEIIAPIVDEINTGGLIVDTSGSDESTYGHAMRTLASFAFRIGEDPEFTQEDSDTSFERKGAKLP